MNEFYNSGFGWICRHCEVELAKDLPAEKHGRLMREGESESKNPRFSVSAIAKWKDKEQRTLICPRCGIIELID